MEDEKDKGREDLGIKECGKREDKWEKNIGYREKYTIEPKERGERKKNVIIEGLHHFDGQKTTFLRIYCMKVRK